MGGGIAVVGGIAVGVGVARVPAHRTVWSVVWFDVGFVVVVLGVLALVWALVLHLAHRHREQASTSASGHAGAVGSGTVDGQEWRPPVEPTALAKYLAEVNRTMAEHGFGPEAGGTALVKQPNDPTPSWEMLNGERVARYERNQGLFLVHDWVPSDAEDQVADVTIKLRQHGDGPLSRGDIRVVEYSLGPKFTNHSLVCASAADDFAIEVSMWGPMLCMAKVYFLDGRPPLVLDRYVDFPVDTSICSSAAASEPEGPDQAVCLANRLQDLIRRGRRIRANAVVSSNGSSGPIEIWEQDAAITLEDAQRHDLVARLERRDGADTARGMISGAWATRSRMDRKLALLSDVVRELDHRTTSDTRGANEQAAS